MELLLFSDRSLWTMFHGVVLGGGAMLGLAAALFSLRALGAGGAPPERTARELGWLLVATAALLWLAVLVGTYVTFPPYRAKPPEGLADLAAYPKALIQSRPDTAWLHSFGMEVKEHVPWIAAMLATAAAFVSVRLRALLAEASVRRMTAGLVAITLALVAAVSALGVFANKVAPLQLIKEPAMLAKEPTPDTVTNGAALAAFLAAGIGAFAMGLVVILNEVDLLKAPALYGPAGGVTGRTTLAAVLWLIAWVVLHRRWRGRQLDHRRVHQATLGLIGLGVLLCFPPLWWLLG